MVMTDRIDPIAHQHASLTRQLRRKSRGRRYQLKRMVEASTSRPRRNDILPRLELSYVAVTDLRPSPRKVRKLDPVHVREIASSINVLGFCDPLLVGRENEIVHGEARYEAARQLGLDRIPCIRIEHLSKDEQRVLRLAVNRLAEKGQWDLDALKIEFEELIVIDAPIEITGFSPGEIDHVILGDGAAGLEEGPLQPDRSRRSRNSATYSSSGPTASSAAARLTQELFGDSPKATIPRASCSPTSPITCRFRVM
jgi:hypothetical protein